MGHGGYTLGWRRLAAALTATAWFVPAAAQSNFGGTLVSGGGQFITYEGFLGGSITFTDPARKVCGDIYFPLDSNATLRIGVNPPSWDANPFYFELYRDGLEFWEEPSYTSTAYASHSSTSSPTGTPTISGEVTAFTGGSTTSAAPTSSHGAIPRQLVAAPWPIEDALEGRDAANAMAERSGYCSFSCTTDTIFNLRFQSTYYFTDPNISISRMLDLTKASVAVVSNQALAASEPGPYYSITGDTSTWVGNGSGVNAFDWQTPLNYTPPSKVYQCSLQQYPRVIWSATTPFTYTLNFTNHTAIASFVVALPGLGNITLAFAGNRSDLDDYAHEPAIDQEFPDSVGRCQPIWLASPADHPAAPHFLFGNGSEFYFNGTNAFANGTRNDSTSDHKSLAPGLGHGVPWSGVTLAAWVGALGFAVAWAALLS